MLEPQRPVSPDHCLPGNELGQLDFLAWHPAPLQSETREPVCALFLASYASDSPWRIRLRCLDAGPQTQPKDLSSM